MWYGSNAADVADPKLWNMHTNGFKIILDGFVPAFDCIKPLCTNLRKVLFPLTNDRKLDLTTKPDHRKLYDPLIKAFDDAIVDLENRSLELYCTTEGPTGTSVSSG